MFRKLFTSSFAVSLLACGSESPVEIEDSDEVTLEISVFTVRMKPNVACANEGDGERVVIDATEHLTLVPSSVALLRLALTYTEITASGDFTRTPYTIRTAPVTIDTIDTIDETSNGRSATTLVLTAPGHTFACTIAVLWRKTDEGELQILGRDLAINCLPP
jgi:hypothetical protein